MSLVFTICSNNYLSQAISLGNSLLLHNHDYTFKIGLVDKRSPEIDYDSIPYDVIEVEKISIPSFSQMILRYNVTELNTAVKPFYFLYFFQTEGKFDNIIYLDPDILVYKSFSELEDELKSNNIVITPHITLPINDASAPSENEFLNTGLYNLGFIALKRTDNSFSMLSWWAERLKEKAHIALKSGMFTDQLWINYVPLFYRDVKIFTHPGYNMAYWNLHERFLNEENGTFFVNNNPLVFFHFSGFNPAITDQISKYQNRFSFNDRIDILPLFKDYISVLNMNNFDFYQKFKCFFHGIKEENDDKIATLRVRQIPVHKRVIRKVINYITQKFNIVLDYSIFYER